MITEADLKLDKEVLTDNKLNRLRRKFNFSRLSRLPKFYLLVGVVGVIIIALLTFSFGSSSKNPLLSPFSAKLEVASLSLDKAQPSTLIEIKGTGFGVMKKNGALAFPGAVIFTGEEETTDDPEGAAAILQTWTETKITAFVPTGAQSGYVYVILNSEDEPLVSNGLKFAIQTPEPKIHKLSNQHSAPGEIIEITGEGLGNFMNPPEGSGGSPGASFPGRVAYVDKQSQKEGHVDIFSWSPTAIELYAPTTFKEGSLKVYLGYEGGKEAQSNSLAFSLDPVEPKLTSLDKETLLPTEAVVLMGENLGSMIQDQIGNKKFPGRVIIDRTQALISSWSKDKILAFVPPEVTAGDHQVKVVLDYLDKGANSNDLKLNLAPPLPKVSKAPDQVYPSELITIKGQDFGNQIKSPQFGLVFPGKIYFSDTDTIGRDSLAGVVVSWTEDTIRAFVPMGVKDSQIWVARTAGSKDYFSEGTRFTVASLKPTIEKLADENLKPGEILEIFGHDFGNQIFSERVPTSYPGRVYFGDRIASLVPNGWDNHRIMVFVPAGIKDTQVKIQLVFGKNSLYSNPVAFAASDHNPTLSTVNSRGKDKVRVTLKGSGFGNPVKSSANSSKFPGKVVLKSKASGDPKHAVLGAKQIEPKIESWEDTKIVVSLPNDIREEEIYVVLDGVSGQVVSNVQVYKSNN